MCLPSALWPGPRAQGSAAEDLNAESAPVGPPWLRGNSADAEATTVRRKPGVDGLFTTRDYRLVSSTHHVRRGRLAWPPVLHRGLSGNDGAGDLFDDDLGSSPAGGLR